MAGRPPLPIGQHGSITSVQVETGGWESRTRLRCLDGVTRKVRARGRTKSASLSALQDALDLRVNQGVGGMVTSESTLVELFDAWWPTYKSGDANESTKELYVRAFIDIKAGLGDIRVREAITPRLEGFLRALPTPSQQKRCRVVLSHMMRFAVRAGASEANPVTNVVLNKVTAPEPKAHSAVEMKDLQRDLDVWVASQPDKAVMRRRMADAVEIYLVTGVRTGELLALLVSEIDLNTRTYLVTGTAKRTSVDGLHRQPITKGKKDRGGTFPWGAMPTVTRLVGAAKTDLLFANRKGGIIEPSNFRRALREFREAYPKWADVTPRSFRKTVATEISRADGSLKAADQLGHAGGDQITKKHYIQRDLIVGESPALASLARKDAS